MYEDKNQVMIVEDCLIQSTVLKKILESEQFQVIDVFNSGDDVIQGVQEKTPNLILMDVYLNGRINGYEAAQKIREKYQIPFIFVSALSNSELAMKINSLDNSTVLSKPVSKKDLLDAIGRVMKPVQAA